MKEILKPSDLPEELTPEIIKDWAIMPKFAIQKICN